MRIAVGGKFVLLYEFHLVANLSGLREIIVKMNLLLYVFQLVANLSNLWEILNANLLCPKKYVSSRAAYLSLEN